MFQKGQRTKVKLKVAISGPSGSGKTYSGLLIAKGLGGKIALLDTENGSGSLYAGLPEMPEYDVLEMHAPFLTNKYVQAINAAVKEGYNVLVIDSITHQWAGEGGIIDRKDKEQMAKPSANSYTLWAKYTPEHEQFKQAIVQAQIHIIATVRSKQDYILTENEKGKQAPKKVGMAPVQRDAVEYEFTTVFDMSMEHYATVSKDRTHLFDGEAFRPDVTTGEKLLAWMSSAADAPAPKSSTSKSNASPAQSPTGPAASVGPKVSFPSGVQWKATKRDLEILTHVAGARGWTSTQLSEYMTMRFQTNKLSEFNKEGYDALIGVVGSVEPLAAQANWQNYLASQNAPEDDLEIKPDEPDAAVEPTWGDGMPTSVNAELPQ